MIANYIRLFRVNHYIKNLIIFFPLFFSARLFNVPYLLQSMYGFVFFCIASSIVYIFNDIWDAARDKVHPVKRNRPIASGAISKKNAWICICLGVLLDIVLIILLIHNTWALYIVFAYWIINIAYSMGIKRYPILDVIVLALDYIMRVFYGGALVNLKISGWLYLMIFFGACYLGYGKRRDEMRYGKAYKEVLKTYSVEFLDRNMYVSMGLSIVFYSLWAVNSTSGLMKWSIPIFAFILTKYSLDVEIYKEGDPVDIIYKDKALMISGVMIVIYLFLVLYII